MNLNYFYVELYDVLICSGVFILLFLLFIVLRNVFSKLGVFMIYIGREFYNVIDKYCYYFCIVFFSLNFN